MIKIHIPVNKCTIEIDGREFSKYLRYIHWHIFICYSDKITGTYADFLQKNYEGKCWLLSTFSSHSEHLTHFFNVVILTLVCQFQCSSQDSSLTMNYDKLERISKENSLDFIEITWFEPRSIYEYRIF